MQLFFDYSCPYAYLAFTQLARLEALSGKRATLKPMLLGGVFAAVGTAQNLMNELGPAKAAHNFADMNRWAAAFGEPLRMPPEHPRRTVEALRATLLAGVDRAVVAGFYRAYWVDGRAPSSPDTIRDVLRDAGHDPEPILARLGDDDVKRALRVATDEAIAHGIFGAPAIVTDDGALFWGQDRLPFAFGLPLSTFFPDPAGTKDSAMTQHTLELYWDFSSPFAYLGSTQAEALAARTGAKLELRPMLLGALFKAIGQVDVPLAAFSDAKKIYMLKDLERWAAFYGVPFRWPSRFPMSTVKALRVYLALPEERRAAFRHAVFRAYWAEDRDISDEAVLRELVGEGAADVLAKTTAPEIKEALFAATDRAVKAGVFGAPTWVVDGRDLYWGQDRIALVERALVSG